MKKRERPRFGLPPELALQSETMTEAAQRFAGMIKPNYARVRRNYIAACLGGAIVVLILQIALFIVFKFQLLPLEFKTSVFVHLLKYLIIPSVLNFSAVLYAWLVHRYHIGSEFVQNFAPILTITIICAVTACAHSVYSITMMLFCLPVFMASIYGQMRMVMATSGAGCLCLVAAVICRIISPYRKDSIDTKLVPEAISALAFLIIATCVAGVMISLLNTQKGRLINAARQAEKSRAEAQEANKAKSDFLANMSHEIRTPLNAIIGMTEMISREAEDDNILEYAGDIQQASSALLAIINDILDLSKIESGRIEIVESNYELGSLINDSYNMVAVRWREKGLTATIICDPELPRLLYGDEYHLRQILVNLLSNAVKYTNAGGIELCVSGEENNDILRLEVIVKDTGIGIREEDIPKLFGKFSRLDYAKNRSVEGAGLGLSITKQLVELMHGTIQVQSIYGVGSSFTVRIPQKIADRTPIGDIHSTYLDLHGNIEQYQQSFEAPEAQILVVDDVQINLHVICKLLEPTKMRIDTATSGRECLKKICEHRYDLILMDHMMPEMDGVETLRAMHELKESRNEGVPVIMLTANAMLGAREQYLDVGFVDYLSKPVRGAKLERMIERYLPKEKLVRLERENGEDKAALGPLIRLCRMLPEVDTNSGISYCAGDEAFYLSMLREFSEGDRDTALELHFKAEDWKNYQISAHAMKSAAKMVGFTDLSEQSLAMEEAAKQGDVDAIRAGHAALIGHYRAIADTLKQVLDI